MSKPIESPNEKIKQRQESIYSFSAVLALFLVFLWGPLLMVRETGLRPMGQVAMTAVLLMIGMPILLLRVVVQIVTTWPNKKISVRAVVALLAPIIVLALLQWLILGVRGVVYET